MPEKERPFKYKAFISYSRKNEKIASKLHEALETYTISAKLIQNLPHLPKKLGRFFIDKEEMSAHHSLEEAIKDGLNNSEFLILICSPDAVSSSYVNDEIEYFIKHRDRKKIIPYTIAGEPNATTKPNIDDIFEAFPSALRKNSEGIEENPLSIDIRPGMDSPKRAFLKVVATLLYLDFDDLWQRDKRRRQKQNIIISILVGTLFSVLMLMMWYNWETRTQQDQTLKEQGNIKKELQETQKTIKKTTTTIQKSQQEAIAHSLCLMKKQQLTTLFKNNKHERTKLEKQLRKTPNSYISNKVDLEWMHALQEMNAVKSWTQTAQKEHNVPTKLINHYKVLLFDEINKQHQTVQIKQGKLQVVPPFQRLIIYEKLSKLRAKEPNLVEQVTHFFL